MCAGVHLKKREGNSYSVLVWEHTDGMCLAQCLAGQTSTPTQNYNLKHLKYNRNVTEGPHEHLTAGMSGVMTAGKVTSELCLERCVGVYRAKPSQC